MELTNLENLKKPMSFDEWVEKEYENVSKIWLFLKAKEYAQDKKLWKSITLAQDRLYKKRPKSDEDLIRKCGYALYLMEENDLVTYDAWYNYYGDNFDKIMAQL